MNSIIDRRSGTALMLECGLVIFAFSALFIALLRAWSTVS
jgi:hypothetical protein